MGIFKDRLQHAWNAFTDQEQPSYEARSFSMGGFYGYRPDKTFLRTSNDRSIVSAVYNRVAIDVAAVRMSHVRLDQNGRFVETISSGLNNCLTLEANIDQAARAFVQDAVMTMFDKGVIAIVPVDTSISPEKSGGYDIKTMRIGTVVEWFPNMVRLCVYNQLSGQREEILLSKTSVAIVENPLYAVMNEPNSTLQRLIRKLNLLDGVDEASGNGKLDLIIQLPYVIKSQARQQQADERAKSIEMQLKGSKYGIAYTDGTEKITQLNRPAENNLMTQITYLTNQLFAQLGITEAVFDGTADEKTMLNYNNRTIEPILASISGALKRTFLTPTGRTQGQSVEFYRDPFKLVALSDLAECADKFTRNAILSSNEIRGIIGMAPSTDPTADQLINKNIAAPVVTPTPGQPVVSNQTPQTPLIDQSLG
jgi:hypothetical protein